MPFMPAALIWPYEWLMVVVWILIGAYFFFNMSKGRYANSVTTFAIKEEGSYGTQEDVH